MLTFNTILKELKDVPVHRLEDLYSIIHSYSLRANTKKSGSTRKKMLSFAGSFSDLIQADYNNFVEETTRTRNALFGGEINL
jgi:hypothetical protein